MCARFARQGTRQGARHWCGRPRGLLPGRGIGGTAAIEFGLIAPMMALIVIGTFDSTLALVIQNQVAYASQEIAIAVTNIGSTADGTNTSSITVAQGTQAMSIIYAVMPMLRSGFLSTTAYSVTLSGVTFTPTVAGCTTGCTYTANVAWSTSLALGSANSSKVRTCGVALTQIDPASVVISSSNYLTTAPTANVTVLPTSGYTVADVSVKYTPTFLKFVTGPITFIASTPQPPRGSSADFLRYDKAGAASNAQVCTGYKS